MIKENIIFYLFSTFLVISAFMVIISSHPVFSVCFLVSCFIFASFILLMLECEFLALIVLMVYVGSIAILFLFAVMMLEFKFKDLSKNSIKYLPVGFVFGICLLLPIVAEISNNFYTNLSYDSFYFNQFQNWFELVDSISDVEVYGQVLYTYFVLQLLLIGLILLLVLIGIAYLTNNFNDSKATLDQAVFKQLSRNSKIYLVK